MLMLVLWLEPVMGRLTTLVADHVAGGKESACQAGDVGVNPGSGRSPGE